MRAGFGNPPEWDGEFAEFLDQVWAAVESLDGKGIADTIAGQLSALPRPPQFAEIMVALGVLAGQKRIMVAEPHAPWTGQWVDVKWRAVPLLARGEPVLGILGGIALAGENVRHIRKSYRGLFEPGAEPDQPAVGDLPK